jgi:hypothetical protein
VVRDQQNHLKLCWFGRVAFDVSFKFCHVVMKFREDLLLFTSGGSMVGHIVNHVDKEDVVRKK